MCYSHFTSLLNFSRKMAVLNIVTIKHFLWTQMERVCLQLLNSGSKYGNMDHTIRLIRFLYMKAYI